MILLQSLNFLSFSIFRTLVDLVCLYFDTIKLEANFKDKALPSVLKSYLLLTNSLYVDLTTNVIQWSSLLRFDNVFQIVNFRSRRMENVQGNISSRLGILKLWNRERHYFSKWEWEPWSADWNYHNICFLIIKIDTIIIKAIRRNALN